MNGVLLYGGALKGDAVLSGKKYKMIAGKALQDNKNITSLTIKNVHYIAENILGNCTVFHIFRRSIDLYIFKVFTVLKCCFSNACPFLKGYFCQTLATFKSPFSIRLYCLNRRNFR